MGLDQASKIADWHIAKGTLLGEKQVGWTNKLTDAYMDVKLNPDSQQSMSNFVKVQKEYWGSMTEVQWNAVPDEVKWAELARIIPFTAKQGYEGFWETVADLGGAIANVAAGDYDESYLSMLRYDPKRKQYYFEGPEGSDPQGETAPQKGFLDFTQAQARERWTHRMEWFARQNVPHKVAVW